MHFRPQWTLFLLIGVIVTAGIGIGVRVYSRPPVLRIAVGPPDSDDAKLVQAIGPRLSAHAAPFRLRSVVVESPAAAGALVDKGEVDLAIVRQDEPIPANAQAIAIFHHNSIILMTLDSTGVKEVTDLAGRTIGVIGHSGVDKHLPARLLPYFGVDPDSVAVETFAPSAAATALKQGRVAAVLIASPVTARAANEVVAALTHAGAAGLVFIPLENAEAVAKRAPAFVATNIDAGVFGGSPARPLQSVPTLQFAHFLDAKNAMSNSRAADVARLLFAMRPGLAIDFPAANHIEGPNTKKDALVPVHPGAAAFFDGEEEDFFEEYSDIFYFALAGLGLVGSGAAGLQRLRRPTVPAQDRELFRRLRVLLEQVRGASSETELAERECELHDVFASLLIQAEHHALEDAQLGALSVAIEHLRRTIEARRAALAQPAFQSA